MKFFEYEKRDIYNYTVENFINLYFKDSNIDNYKYMFNKYLDKYINLCKNCNSNGYIAGGCFKDIFTNKTPNDYDIYFKTEEDYTKTFDYLYANKNFTFKESTSNSSKFIDNETNAILNLVNIFYGDINSVLDKFDFTITKIAYDGEHIYCIEWFYEDLNSKLLCIENQKLLYPIQTLRRMFKYSRYGYNVETESFITILNQIRTLNDNEYEDILNEIIYEEY